MAWPPPVLPVNRSNATPQLDTHPADHNALAQAINDIVLRLQAQDWVSFVPTWDALVPGGAPVTFYKRYPNPNQVEIVGSITWAANTTMGFSTMYIPDGRSSLLGTSLAQMPYGRCIMQQTGQQAIGGFVRQSGNSAQRLAPCFFQTNTARQNLVQNMSGMGPLAPFTWASGDSLLMHLSVPLAPA